MTEWWRGSVTYQVYPRSFQDSTGDGIGDLAGITRRLPHLARLGVDAVWLSPIFKSPMADMGYDISDYCDIDPLFGTLADFDRLLRPLIGREKTLTVVGPPGFAQRLHVDVVARFFGHGWHHRGDRLCHVGTRRRGQCLHRLRGRAVPGWWRCRLRLLRGRRHVRRGISPKWRW